MNWEDWMGNRSRIDAFEGDSVQRSHCISKQVEDVMQCQLMRTG